MFPIRISPALHAAPLSFAGLFAVTLAMVACDRNIPTDIGGSTAAVAALEKVSGDLQTALPGARLDEPLVVRAVDSAGQPVRGAAVRFAVRAGQGKVQSAEVRTDRDGLAQTFWTIGTLVADSQRVEAVVDGAAGGAWVGVLFSASVRSGPVSVIEAASSQDLTLPMGVLSLEPLRVRVTDKFGNPVSGARVEWSSTGGAVEVSTASSETDAEGLASVSVRAMAVGVGAVSARVGTLAAVVFQVSVVSPSSLAPARIEVGQGEGTAVPAGSTAGFFTVVVRDANGYPVQGAKVHWAFDPAFSGDSLLPPMSRTTASGIATTLVVFGPQAGSRQIIARVEGLPDSAAVFHARALAGPVAVLERLNGDGQTGEVGTELPKPLRVRAKDAHGNVVPDVSVAWSALGAGSLSSPSTITDTAGVTEVIRTLGITAGTQIVQATAGTAVASFSAQATPAAPAELKLVSGADQRFLAGLELPQPYVVRVRDRYGNAVPGAPLAWSVVAGGGKLSAADTVTAADGTGSARHVLGAAIGANTVEVRTGALTPVTIAATGFRGTLVLESGDGQVGTVGAPLAKPLVVRVKDDLGTPVAGAPVTWSVVAGLGTLDTTAATSNADGLASAILTLGLKAGTAQVVAQLGPSLVTFNARAQGVNGEDHLEKVSGDGQMGPGGQTLPAPYVVRVLDAGSAPVAGVAVRWSVAAGSSGSISASTTLTDNNGLARVWATLPQSGSQTVVAHADALDDSVRFTSSVTSSMVPAIIEPYSTTEYQGIQGEWLLAGVDAVTGASSFDTVMVRVLSANRLPIAGATVTWAVTLGGGQTSTLTGQTDSLGIARVFWKLGVAGAQELQARTAGVAAPAIFTATAAGTPDTLVKLAGDEGAGAGAVVPTPLRVIVYDAAGNPVRGAKVRWVISAGGGALSADGTATSWNDGHAVLYTMTDRYGIAQVWRQLGSTSGSPAKTGAVLDQYTYVPGVTFTHPFE
ncbi:MAG TPA: Ig-like domain-containing protein [Gemmatimonadaceae bacterium]